jgi:DNA-binding response OmpR family regulator
MSKTILMVDDDRRLCDLVKAYLEQEDFRVLTAGDGQEALHMARQERPDLVILDVMMPTMDGYTFMRAQARERDIPVILLTARVDEGDKVLGLELGADDYVTKPFSLRELLARIRAVLRRTGSAPVESDMLRAGGIVLDKERRLVSVDGKRVDLTPFEFELLAALMAAPGRVFTRLALLDRLQGSAYEGYERTIDFHVRNLRTKIEADPSHPLYIQTVFGVGYRFME